MYNSGILSFGLSSQPALPPKRAAMLLLVSLAVCLALRIWLVCNTESITKDGAGYIEMARRWSDDPADALRSVRLQPGYPAAISWAHRLLIAFGGPTDILGWDLAGQAVSVAASVVAMLAVWFFASALMDRRIACIAVLLFSIARKWSQDGADVIADALAVCFELWTMVLALWVLRFLGSRCGVAMLLAALTGIVGAAAYYARMEAIHIVVVVAACWLIFCGWRGKKWLRASAAVGVMLAAVALCVVPYMLYIGGPTNDDVFQNFFSRAAGDDVAYVRAGMFLWLWESLSDSSLVRFVGQLFEAMHPVLGVAMCIWLVTWLAGKATRSQLLTSIAVSPRGPGVALLVGSLIIMAWATITNYQRAGYFSHRYLLLNAAMLSSLSAGGVVVLANWVAVLGGRLPRRLNPRVITWLVTGVVGGFMLAHALRPLHDNKEYIREAGLYIAQQAREGDFLLTDRALILHYAQIEGRALTGPIATQRIISWAGRRDKPATLLAISDCALPDERTTMCRYLRREGFVPLNKFFRGGEEGGDVIIVFRLSRQP